MTWAGGVSPAAIRRRADRANAPSLDETRDVERGHFLRWWWFDEGRRLGLEAELPASQGAVVTKALRRVADRLADDPDEDDGFSSQDRLEQRLADALHALASQRIARDEDTDRATVVVHAGLDDRGRIAWGQLEGGPVVHPEVARRLCCDARLQFVLSDRHGNALGIGRAWRAVPAWLMRQLRYRDHGCTFPGCAATAFLQAHHIQHWEDGGRTDLDNLTLVCHFHHKLVHEFGWKVRLEGSVTRWSRPDGRPFLPRPGPTTLDLEEVA